MPTYERSVRVDAEAGPLFSFLSDVGNLPLYFGQMTSAERLDGERVHTTAMIQPEGEPERQVEGEAWFRTVEDEQRIEWGSEGPNDYRGELDVTASGSGCEVSVRITTGRGEAEEIEEGLEATLTNVKRLGEEL